MTLSDKDHEPAGNSSSGLHNISGLTSQVVREQLAPSGVLRAAINLSNFLLVTSKDQEGNPEGVSPAMARHLAARLGVPVKLITYPGPGPLADDLDNWDIGNIANEKERAKTIEFSGAYCNIQEQSESLPILI